MRRIAVLDDGVKTGQWFDADKATCLKENTVWDGSNHISKATGSQTEHEALWITAGGQFVLNRWSQWQGTIETYELIWEKEAAQWLVKNEFSDEEIPEVFKEAVSALEIE